MIRRPMEVEANHECMNGPASHAPEDILRCAASVSMQRDLHVFHDQGNR